MKHFESRPLDTHSLAISWLEDFNHPLEIEIGIGKSVFLCDHAEHDPSCRFIGIDILEHWCREAAHIANKRSLDNIIFVNDEGHRFLANHVLAGSLNAIHIYFPPPGPQSLKIFKPGFIDASGFVDSSGFIYESGFVDELYRVLRPGAPIRILTDDRIYFREIYRYLNSDLWHHVNWCSFPFVKEEGMLIGTPCEREYGAKYILQAYKRE